jgi:cytochrome c6
MIKPQISTRKTTPKRRQYLISVILSLWLWLSATPIAQAAETLLAETLLAETSLESGSTIFQAQCAACHQGGGNIIRRGKNLKLKTLERNHVDTLEAIQALVTQGKGNMSAYGDRLTIEAITAVSEYVLAQAEGGWSGN